MLNRLLPFVFLFSTLCGCSFFETDKTRDAIITKKEDFFQQIKTVDCDDADRLDAVKDLFRKMGVDEAEIKVEEFENVKNVVLTLKGKTDETVVVGGHYDKTTLGCGAIDNWTGIVIVANLYNNFKHRKNNKTYKFVAFGEEEKGLYGSKAMVDEISRKDRLNYCAMVNFDSFGFTDVWNLESISDNDLIGLATDVAAKRGFTFQSKNYRGASSDSKSFLQNNIPAITLSGLGEDWREYLHQEKDQLENIDYDKVFDNFLFSYEFLNEIDNELCNAFR